MVRSIFTKFGSTTQFDPQPYRPIKFRIPKIQDGGRPPFWKQLNRHNSATVGWIAMKFDTMTHFLPTVACRISSGLKWYKNYKNRLRLAKVIVKNKLARFLWFTVYNVPAQETAKHHATFCWLPLSDVASPTTLCDGTQTEILANFCVVYLQRATCSTFQTCILNSH